MWGVYLWKAGDSVAKKKCTLENRRSNKWLNGLKKKKKGGRKKTNDKKADNKIRCLHWIWKVCKTAQSLFPNLQKTNPENNTVIWSNKEKVLFFFLFLLEMFVNSIFLFHTKQHLCHGSLELASSIAKTGCSWCYCTALNKLWRQSYFTCAFSWKV